MYRTRLDADKKLWKEFIARDTKLPQGTQFTNERKNDMTFITFRNRCTPGTHVTDGDRTGVVAKISKDKDKVLVVFPSGSREWLYYYEIELN